MQLKIEDLKPGNIIRIDAKVVECIEDADGTFVGLSADNIYFYEAFEQANLDACHAELVKE